MSSALSRSAQAALGVLVVVAIVALYASSQRAPRPERSMDASSVFTDDWRGRGPQHAFDGDPATEWHAEDMSAGTLVRRWDAPISIRRVTLLNARNPPWLDRATDRYRIELRDGGGSIVAQVAGRAAPGERVPYDVEAAGVRELRFVAETFHGSSAGVAELIVEVAE